MCVCVCVCVIMCIDYVVLLQVNCPVSHLPPGVRKEDILKELHTSENT